MAVPSPRNVSILEEYVFGEISGTRILLTPSQFKVASERYGKLAPQLAANTLTEVDRLNLKLKAEMAISEDLRQECEALAKATYQLQDLRNKLHSEKLALQQEIQKMASRKWYHLLGASLCGGGRYGSR